MRKSLKLFLFVIGIFSLVGFFSVSNKASAAVLTPGALFSACGDIQAAGTYYLNANISTTSPVCIRITTTGVTISATTTKTITGNIIATSTGNSNGYSFAVSGAVGLLGDTNLSGAGIVGTLTLNGTSYNQGAVTGNAVFNDDSYNKLGSWTPRDSNRNWQAVTSSADGTKLAAVVQNGQIYTSIDSGVTWTPRDSNRGWSSISSSADGVKLVAAIGRWSGSSGQIYTSIDSGVTWTPRESNRNWFSITSSADGTKLAAFGSQIYTSTDSGVTWTPRESNRNWWSVTSSADGTKLAAVAYNDQIYTSIDSGVTWTPRESNRNWRGITSSSDGTKLAAVVSNGQIYTSIDSGVTWTPRESNRSWTAITSSADGMKLAAVEQGGGAGGGQIYTSTDSGVTWSAGGVQMYWYGVTSSSDGTKLVAVAQFNKIYTLTMGGITGTATFNGNSYNQGSVIGDAYFTNSTYTSNPISGSVSGNIYFTPSFGSIVTFNVGTASTSNTCLSARCVWSTNTTSYNFGSATSIFNFYGNSQLATSTTLTTNAVNFYDISLNSGTIVASSTTFGGISYNSSVGVVDSSDVLFNGSSYNLGIVSGTSIVFSGTSYNSGTISTPNTITFNDTSYNSLTIIASSTIFAGSSYNNGSITGTTTFNDSSYLYTSGTINGNAKFTTTYYDTSAPTGGIFTVSGTSIWRGTVNGTILGSDDAPITSFVFSGSGTNNGTINVGATFNDTSYNSGTISTPNTITFNDTSYNSLTIIASSTIFAGSSYNNGSITGTTTFNDSSYLYTSGTINGNAKFTTTYYDTSAPTGGIFTVSGTSIWRGTVNGTILGSDDAPITSFVFSGSGNNEGVINLNTVFNESSYNTGTINGNVDLYVPAPYPVGGVIVGEVTYHGYDVGVYFNTNAPGAANDGDWNNLLNWWTDGTFATNASYLPNSASVVVVTSQLTTNNSGNAVAKSITFLDGSCNNISITVIEGAVFEGSSYNTGNITGSATFTADSYSYNSSSGSVSPNAGGSASEGIYFTPTSGTTTVTFNIGNPGVYNYCNGNPCVWSDTNQYTFGDGSGSVTAVWNFYVDGTNYGNIYVPANGSVNFYDGTINGGDITGNVYFYDSSANNDTINGNVVFNGGSYNNDGATISSNAVFNDNSFSRGNIGGSATFTADSYSYNPSNNNSGSMSFAIGSVSGGIYFIPASGTTTVTFNIGDPNDPNNTTFCGGNQCYWDDSTQYTFGDGSGSVTTVWNFYGNSYNNNSIYVPTNGGVNLYGTSYNNGQIYVPSNGAVNFHDSSVNSYNGNGYIDNSSGGTVAFNDNSYNSNYSNGNSITGNAIFNDNSYNNGNMGGTATFTADSYSYNSNSGYVSPNTSGPSVGGVYFIPASGTTTVTFNIGDPNDPNNTTFCGGNQCYWDDGSSLTFGDGNGSVTPIWNFYGNSYNNNSIYVPTNGEVNFYGNSYNSGSIYVPSNGLLNFYDTSYNNGSIDGNADVYFSNPNKNISNITGITRYHGYPAFYFNDSIALGGAGDGEWTNVQNWWTDEQFTIPAGSMPDTSNDTFVYSDILSDVIGGSAAVKTITFTGSAVNGISINVTDGATFTASSTNNGNIQGDVTFEGEDPSAGSGSITGLLTRLFSSNASSTHDYTTEGGRGDWIIIARNAVVDLTSATYSRITNIFKALGNGLFITNPSIDGGASVVPEIVVNVPATGTSTIKWLPNIDWDTSATCEYKMDGSSTYLPLNCANNGSDVPRPTAGSHVMFVKGTDSLGNISEKSVAFTYDNTVPTYTSCGTDLLDEATRPYYYLTSDVYGNCNVTVDNVEIRGSLTATSTVGYTIHGNVLASALSTGDNGFNITLKYVGVTGYVTTVGAPGGSGIDGGNGGNITIATSTTGAVYANGGSTSANNTDGGNGGNIAITYSTAIASSTAVSSTGGNSTVCGNGGNGGTVTITDSGNYATPTVTGGTGHSCGGGGGGSSGQSGSGTVAGNPPGYTPPSPAPSTPSTPARSVSSSGGTTNPTYNPLSNKFTLPVANLAPLKLPALPTFGDEGAGSFSFRSLVSQFLFAPLPPALINKLTKAQLAYLASAGVSTQQDLLLLRNKTISLPAKDVPPGIITLTSDGSNVPMSATYDPKNYLIEKATVNSLSTITIYFTPTTPSDNIIATIGTSTIRTLKKVANSSAYSASFTAPEIGTYNMSVTGAPFDLKLDVIKTKPPVSAVEKVKQQSVWGVMNFWK